MDSDRQLALKLSGEKPNNCENNLLADLQMIDLLNKQIEEEEQIARDHAYALQLSQSN
jgi:hypothetical protein